MQGDTFTIQENNYKIYCSKGIVTGKETRSDTYVSGGGGSGYVHNGVGASHFNPITSQVVVNDRFYIIEGENKERAIELQDWNIKCRNGHEVAIVWVIKNNNQRGYYLGYKNFTTGETYIDKDSVEQTAVKPKAFLRTIGFDGAALIVGVACFSCAGLAYQIIGQFGMFFLPLPLILYMVFKGKKEKLFNQRAIGISMRVGDYLSQVTAQ